MLNFTFCTETELLHLNLFQRCGKKAAITDYAILKGGFVSNNNFIDNKVCLENRIGGYWTSTINTNTAVGFSCSMGFDFEFDVKYMGARPVIKLSEIIPYANNLTRKDNETIEFEFGEYLRKAAQSDMQLKLEELYQNKALNTTGKLYEDINPEYEYDGKKYIRQQADFSFNCNSLLLSNGEKYENGSFVWVEVEPIKWKANEKDNLAITEEIIFAGIPFNKDNCNGNFNETYIKQYMDNHFAKDIIPSKTTKVEKKTNQYVKIA